MLLLITRNRSEIENGMSARSRTARSAHQASSWAWAGKAFSHLGRADGPLVVSHLSSSNGHTRNLAEQNRHRHSRSNPSTHSFSPLPLPRHSERATELVGRRATQREERKRARGAVLSPSPTCAPTVGWTRHHQVASQRRLFAPARTDEVASVGSVEVSTPCAHPQVVRR
jgi:hypothetical protein